MSHPLARLPAGVRAGLFWSLLVLTLITGAALSSLGAPLQTAASPNGIISYELAGSVEAAARMLAAWDAPGHAYAAFNLGLDYLYLCVYSTTIALSCLWAGTRLRAGGRPGGALAAPLAWVLWLAAACDATENAALLIELFNGPASPWPQIAAACATVKFAIVIAGIGYTLYGALAGRAASTK